MEIHFSLEQESSHYLRVVANAWGMFDAGILFPNAAHMDAAGTRILMLRHLCAIGRYPYIKVRCALSAIPLGQAVLAVGRLVNKFRLVLPPTQHNMEANREVTKIICAFNSNLSRSHLPSPLA